MNGFPLTIRKLPSGDSFWIHVEPNYRISTCKQKIQRMRGMPANNIRLAMPKGSSESISLSSDDYQQRTLASLGLVGSDTSDSESVDTENGPVLELAPITVYIQMPSGRRIKLKDCIDVEAMVDTLEQMVARELEAAHLLEKSESSTEDRFRLFHDRLPMRRGSPITKYKVKHMDVIKLKYGTDEADGNLKQERRKAYQKLEDQKNTMRKSESSGSLRKESPSSSPGNRRSPGERRKQFQKTPSNDIMARLSQSLTSVEKDDFAPARGMNRAGSTSSEQNYGQGTSERGKIMQGRKDFDHSASERRRLMMNARKDSDPRLGSSPSSTERSLSTKLQRDSDRTLGDSPISDRSLLVKLHREKDPMIGECNKSPRNSDRMLGESPANERRMLLKSDRISDPSLGESPRSGSGSVGRNSRRSRKMKTDEKDSFESRTRSRSTNTSKSRARRSKSRGATDSIKSRKKDGKERRSRSVGKRRAGEESKDDRRRSRSTRKTRSGEKATKDRTRSKSRHSKKTNRVRKRSHSRSESNKDSRDCDDIRNLSAKSKSSNGSSRSRRSRTSEIVDSILAEREQQMQQNQAPETKKQVAEETPQRVWKQSSQSSSESRKEQDGEEKKKPSPPSPVSVISEGAHSSTKTADDTKSGVADSYEAKLAEVKEKSYQAKLAELKEKRRLRDAVEQTSKSDSNVDKVGKLQPKHSFCTTSSESSSSNKGKRRIRATKSDSSASRGSIVDRFKTKFEKEKMKRQDSTESDNTDPKESSRQNISRPSTPTSIRLKPSVQDTPRTYSNDSSTIGLSTSTSGETKKEESSKRQNLVKPMATRPLKPSSRDTPPTYSPVVTQGSIKDRIGKFQSGNSDEKSPGSLNGRVGTLKTDEKEETDRKSTASLKDRIGKFQTGDKENTNGKLPEAFRAKKFQAGGKENIKSPETSNGRNGKFQASGKENVVSKSPGLIKQRIGNLQSGEKETQKSPGTIQRQSTAVKSPGSMKNRVGKFQNRARNNSNEESPESSTDLQESGNSTAKPRGSIKDRLGKFQTGGKENNTPGGFQMIGLATLGLKNTVESEPKKKDGYESTSTTYSFFCSNDDMTNDGMSDYNSSDFECSDYESSSDESDSDDEYDSIHVIGPDLTPYEIELDSDCETIRDIKEIVAEAAGIPANELRFGLQSRANGLGATRRSPLTNNFKLLPGDILTVQPSSTVVVKLPDGKSKLELSVFPGTVLGDIKDYIAENIGTTPSRQMLCNFHKNFDEELEDDLPMATDCTLRLTVY